ncbi:BTAD domain-containing putative transcriptional regulator [Lachnospiraceae bacterium 29-84]
MSMEENGWNDILYVGMFGNFSMTWNGKCIVGGSKSAETQFAYLMQLLIHSRKEGISRDKLEQILFGDRDISDLRHATRTVIYNAKKKLKAAGLPDINYIEQKDGIYYWTEEIPVIEDAAEMERLCEEAGQEEDLDRKTELYLKACYYYTAEFLEAQTGTIWIAQEARRYRSLFCSCVENAAQLLRIQKDYFRMEELGIYAAKINPLADWEAITMEAMVSLGRDEDARKFYDDTVELYFQEQGLRPSNHLMELLNKLGAQIGHHYAVLDDIQESLMEEDKTDPGGYLCPYPVFQGIYHMVERMMERGGQSVYLMLCTVVDSKGNPMKDGPILEELSKRLGEAIQKSVRRGDAVNRYGRGQYLVLLVNTTRENCKVLQKRINYHFIVGRQRTGIQYYVNSVICTPGKERIV